MRSPSKLPKVLVLSGFILLMSSFVAYRSGAFNNLFGRKYAVGDGSFNYSGFEATDTFKKPVKNKKGPKTMMSGSKAMILTPPPVKIKDNQQFISDTVEFVRVYREYLKIRNDYSALAARRLMASSSKSAPVFTPEEKRSNTYIFLNGDLREVTAPLIDSLLDEMKRLYPGVVVQDSIQKLRPVIPSTKSGAIFRAQDLDPQGNSEDR